MQAKYHFYVLKKSQRCMKSIAQKLQVIYIVIAGTLKFVFVLHRFNLRKVLAFGMCSSAVMVSHRQSYESLPDKKKLACIAGGISRVSAFVLVAKP